MERWRAMARRDWSRLGSLSVPLLVGMSLAISGCTNSGPFAAAEQALSPAAQMQAVQDEFGPAVNLYRNAVSAGTPDPSLLVELGDTLVDAGSPDDAMDVYWKVLGLPKVDPKSGARLAAVRGLAHAYMVLGQPDRALEHWNEALQLAPDDAAALVGRGVTLDTLGKHEEAQSSYRAVIGQFPHDVPARNNLALSLAMTGHFDEAIEIITPMARSATATPQIRQNLALISGLKGDKEHASVASRMDLDQEATEANLRFFDFVRFTKPN